MKNIVCVILLVVLLAVVNSDVENIEYINSVEASAFPFFFGNYTELNFFPGMWAWLMNEGNVYFIIGLVCYIGSFAVVLMACVITWFIVYVLCCTGVFIAAGEVSGTSAALMTGNTIDDVDAPVKGNIRIC